MVQLVDYDSYCFPDPYNGDEDGCFAMGGELSPEWLEAAYAIGAFPWYSFREMPLPLWFCPLDRFVIFPDKIHVSHSMRTLINSGRYSITFDRDFEGVIRNCSEVTDREVNAPRIDNDYAWLGPEIIEAYTELHNRGLAHSVEVRDQAGTLVGGLYGVYINGCFVGESMFSLVPSGSKLALIALARHLAQIGGKVIDCQFETPHLRSMGGEHISYDRYLQMLKE